MPDYRRMMSRRWLLGILILIASVCLGAWDVAAQEYPIQSNQPHGFILAGQIVDSQGLPVDEADVTVFAADEETILGEGVSGEDGVWRVALEQAYSGAITVVIQRPHFETTTLNVPAEKLQADAGTERFFIETVTLQRRVSPGFWVATLVFAGVLLLIILEKVHATTAALLGIGVIFLVHYLVGAQHPDWRILSFERALGYINWPVIFLIIGMMIIVAVIESTGIFQWLAFQSYRLSRGRSWLLVLILMMVTALASALLDNFTTMLLMVPISLQIALALGLNPAALIIPEVLASNVGGISTLIGTPTNILIGASAGIGFNGFLVNQTPGVILALIVMALIVLFMFRAEWRKTPGGISPALYAKLAENGRIREPGVLWRAGLIFLGTLVLFVVGERYHMEPAVAALAGAAAVLLWVRPDVNDKIKEVDWTTLVFFMALFIMVGAIQEVGLLAQVAQGLSYVVGERLWVGILVIVFGVGSLSLIIPNIPLTAAMLPVVSYLGTVIPGAGDALYYALSMGAAMGGNGLVISGEANLVTAGIAERAGSPIAFRDFMRVGLPVTFATLTVGALWLLLRFIILGG